MWDIIILIIKVWRLAQSLDLKYIFCSICCNGRMVSEGDWASDTASKRIWKKDDEKKEKREKKGRKIDGLY